MVELTPYKKRVIAQGEAWVDGVPRHNNIDDECCPDFSCCYPNLFTIDRSERMASHNSLLRQYGLPVKLDS
jgi:hypothetical protein